MENEYKKFLIGEHFGKRVNEVPLDYLIWIFPKLIRKKKEIELAANILKFFISKGIRVEDNTSTNKGYSFYLKDFSIPKPGGGEVAFTKTFQKLFNSKNQPVYEIGNPKWPIFLEENNGFLISTNYISYNYKFNGLPLIYEKNPNYYFIDSFGRVFNGAFLMRKPYIPNQYLDFSENFLI